MENDQLQVDARIDLQPPALEELAHVIKIGLSQFYEQVESSVERCPNLNQPPFCLLKEGLGSNGGKRVVADVGGPGHLYPHLKKKVYTLRDVCIACESPQSLVIGPGAGPYQETGSNCEMMCNCYISPSLSQSKTFVAKLNPTNRRETHLINIESPSFALMANLLLTDGQAGDVVCIQVSKRRTDQEPHASVTEEISRILGNHYHDRHVALGGVLKINAGIAKMHIMHDFLHRDFVSRQEIEEEWLEYFDMNAPLVCHTVLHSGDYQNLNLRVEHTHGYNASTSTDGGHYHYDVSPDDISYTLHLVPANQLVRIDRC